MKDRHYKFAIRRQKKRNIKTWKKIMAAGKLKQGMKFNPCTKFPTIVFTMAGRNICYAIGLDDLPF